MGTHPIFESDFDCLTEMPELKVVELFCGIGGFHQGLIKARSELKDSSTELEFDVLAAVDINNNSTGCYKLNHKGIEKRVKNGDCCAYAWEKVDGYNTLVCSPPCQPFTRNGNQKDTADSRSKALLSIIEKIKTMKKKHLPRYMVLENVKFFERSESCKMLLEALKSRGFIYRQFLVSPTDLGIPNQRARYFLIAKRGKKMKFHFDPYVKNWKKKSSEVEPEAKKAKMDVDDKNVEKVDDNNDEKTDDGDNDELDEEEIEKHIHDEPQEADYPIEMYEGINVFVREDSATPEDQILGLKSTDKLHSLERYIQELDFADEMWRELYVLNDQLTRRFIQVLDIVRTSSSRSICFTKAYGKYAQGTGSMIDMLEKEQLSTKADTSKDRKPENFQLRYFTEMEVAGIMGFPRHFSFPSELTTRQRYAMLGNSLNVNVASLMIKLMVLGDDDGKLSAKERAEYEQLKKEFE